MANMINPVIVSLFVLWVNVSCVGNHCCTLFLQICDVNVAPAILAEQINVCQPAGTWCEANLRCKVMPDSPNIFIIWGLYRHFRPSIEPLDFLLFPKENNRAVASNAPPATNENSPLTSVSRDQRATDEKRRQVALVNNLPPVMYG